MDEAREKMEKSEMFREFRTGDLKSERWDKREAHSQRMKRALENELSRKVIGITDPGEETGPKVRRR